MKLNDVNTILITGGAGFIGSSLADFLLQNKKVIIVDNFSDFYNPQIKEKNIAHNLQNSNYELYKIDIENKIELKKVFEKNKIDCIVHLAARAGVRPSLKEPELYIKTNILGTLNILELMKEFDVKKMVFASSSSVYGNCRETIFSENLKVTEPISPYAATKSSCEQFCYTFSKLYNMQILCLRFFTVYGPRQRPDLAINKFVNLINNNLPIPVFGDGTTIRDYTYVDDIIDGIVKAIDYDKTQYEIINIGGGSPINLLKMINTIEKALNKNAIMQFEPMQKGDVDKTAADISKAQELLGYSPKVNFEEGIKRFVDSIDGNIDCD